MSIVNLNKTRKARARLKDKARAEENAVKFGRTKAEKDSLKAQNAKSARSVDSHKRER